MENLAIILADGFERAKGGDAIQVYNELLPFYKDGNLPLSKHYLFGWVIYYALHQSPDHEIGARKRMLANYLKLSVPRPHKLHSMVLTEAIRLYKDSCDAAFTMKGRNSEQFSIVKFTPLWDLANLRPGDWRRKEHEDKTLSSTVEKFLTAYIDELESTSMAATPEVTSLVDEALKMYPDTDTLLSQRAQLYVLAGDKESARDMMRRALLNAPRKFFLWNRMASLIAPEESIHLHIALLFKALIMPGQDQFKGRVRLSLAKAWTIAKRPAEALFELERVGQLYETNSWHLPRAYEEVKCRIPEGTVAADPTPLYRKVEHLADKEIYSALPQIAVTKTYHKNPTASKGGFKPAVAWRVTDAAGNHYWLNPSRFSIDPNLPQGTSLLIRIHNSKPVHATLP